MQNKFIISYWNLYIIWNYKEKLNLLTITIPNHIFLTKIHNKKKMKGKYTQLIVNTMVVFILSNFVFTSATDFTTPTETLDDECYRKCAEGCYIYSIPIDIQCFVKCEIRCHHSCPPVCTKNKKKSQVSSYCNIGCLITKCSKMKGRFVLTVFLHLGLKVYSQMILFMW